MVLFLLVVFVRAFCDADVPKPLQHVLVLASSLVHLVVTL